LMGHLPLNEPSSTLQNVVFLVCSCNGCVVSRRYIIVVEHDLSVLDYLSDFICCLYGVPSAYGVVTMPFSVREGNYMASPHTSITHLFLFFPILYFLQIFSFLKNAFIHQD